MSRSYKKAIYKDNGIGKELYHRTIRRVQKNFLRQNKDIPDRRIIMNDYEYCDYISKMEFNNNEELKEIYSRK